MRSSDDIIQLFENFKLNLLQHISLNSSSHSLGITAFVLDRETPGLKVARPESKLGLQASGTCAVHLEDVRVPASSILGEFGRGYRYAAGLLNESRVGIGAQMVGIAQGCLDATVPYTLERKQFGKEIFSFQSMQHQVSEFDIRFICQYPDLSYFVRKGQTCLNST